MDSFSGPGSPRRTSDYPKPEAGLAEWTHKIKALQRQVDEDEEAEQRKLEEEIAAARRARLRRSRGYGGQNDNVDYSDFNDRPILSPETIGNTKSPSDRQTNQEEAMQKLMGNIQYPTDSVKPSMKTSVRTTSSQAEPVSLAAFIGGRATGPRLNRPAPQQNAHDPTQFVDPIPKIPHPVFGRGGIAMPGMTSGKPSSVKATQDDPEAVERYKPSFVTKRTSVPSVAQKYVGMMEQQSNSPVVERPSPVSDTRPESPIKRDPLPKFGIRERTISTPNPSVHSKQIRSTTLPIEKDTSAAPIVRSYSRSPISTISSTSPAVIPTSLRKSPSQNFVAPTPSLARPTQPEPRAVSRGPHIPLSVVSPPAYQKLKPAKEPTPKSPDPTPSLARPIQPEPRPVSRGPQIPPSTIPSPAFQKPAPAKELTPSISRLQGRGFVQNMVKASGQLTTSSLSSVQEKPRPEPLRKSTILDRWQPNENPSTSSPTSPSPAISIPKRKSMPSMQTRPHTKPLDSPTSPITTRRFEPTTPLQSPDNAGKSTMPLLKIQPPESSFSKIDSMLGSATTMVVFKSETPKAEVTEFHMVDELGVKHDISPVVGRQVRFDDRSDVPEPSVKPLSHPTKERARKPRKGKTSSVLVKEDPATRPLYNKPVSPVLPLPTDVPSVIASASPGVDYEMEDPDSKRSFNVAQMAEKWGKSGPIGVKMVSSKSLPPSNVQQKHSIPIKQALPGMTSSQQSIPLQPHKLGRVGSFGTIESSEPIEMEQARPSKAPTSSPRHARIPSTGNRATVMDIASALSQRNDVPGPQATLRTNSLSDADSSTSIDKRRSIYEKYSPPAMPILKEESSPFVSPAGTLSRNFIKQIDASSREDENSLVISSLTSQVQSRDAVSDERQKKSKTVHFDTPLPKVDIDALVSFRNKSPVQSHDAQTIQVEVLSIVGSAANILSQNTDTFYDTEFLAIIHRSKSKASGLATATVWGWKGKRSRYGSTEEIKLQELAKRYGAKPCMVQQFSEPTHLVHVLGGQLTIRQGLRSHWTAENTAMYLVRSFHGVILIDEHDLSIKNLCSAFSYCLSILNTIYVWHGCGSTTLERQAAFWYAQSLTENSSLVELSEGENDNDEMFWMILGEDSFAKADYWKWRKFSPLTDPAIWRIDASLGNDSIISIDFISQEQSPHASVYIIDCVWELFVLVGPNARGQRQNIRLALDMAMAFSKRAAAERPYTPTVHVLILPSRLPLDLRMNVRDLDELLLNNGNMPDHMNILSSSQALDHLQKQSWERDALNDSAMLPLGLDESHAAEVR